MTLRYLPFHTIPVPDHSLNDDQGLIIGSVDPAYLNIGVRIEIRYCTRLPIVLYFDLIRLIPKKDPPKVTRKKNKEKDTNEIKVKKKTRKIAFDPQMWGRFTTHLHDMSDILDRVQIYVVESQVSKRSLVERSAQHFTSFIMTKYQNREPYPVIIELNSRLKGRILRMPDGSLPKKSQKKLASVATARSILTDRGDQFSLNILNQIDKQDDLTDAICQLEVFISMITTERQHKSPGAKKLL